MKTAIVHEWLVDFAGGEQVLEKIYELFPSPVYTLLMDKNNIQKSFLKDADIHTSSLQRIPLITRLYRKLLALFPRAVEEFNLNDYDLILSSSHSVVKGILTHSNQLHICYMHTPMRYAWDLYFQYLHEAGLRGWKYRYASRVLHEIRKWDVISANRVDHFIANSQYIARRIWKVYRREAEVIYPPVNVHQFDLREKKENFYVTASRMVPYKKIDLIVRSFADMPDRKLVVIGTGPDWKKIQKIAASARNIELLGYQPFDKMKELLGQAKAFVFAAEEDFGIVPVEAQACGTPVIAFGQGGAKETVIDKKTGVFFDRQTPESIQQAVKLFEKTEDSFQPKTIRRHAEQFSPEKFKSKYSQFVKSKYEEFLSRKS